MRRFFGALTKAGGKEHDPGLLRTGTKVPSNFFPKQHRTGTCTVYLNHILVGYNFSSNMIFLPDTLLFRLWILSVLLLAPVPSTGTVPFDIFSGNERIWRICCRQLFLEYSLLYCATYFTFDNRHVNRVGTFYAGTRIWRLKNTGTLASNSRGPTLKRPGSDPRTLTSDPCRHPAPTTTRHDLALRHWVLANAMLSCRKRRLANPLLMRWTAGWRSQHRRALRLCRLFWARMQRRRGVSGCQSPRTSERWTNRI
jgi:hypothetical protein